MERQLVLMRHGQAANPVGLGRDIERPLTAAGHLEAARVAADLLEAGFEVGAIVCSGAVRARETADVVARKLGIDGGAVMVVPSLYLGGLDELREAATGFAAGATGLLAVGHNPGWSEAASMLSRAPVGLGTACAARFALRGATWADALLGPAEALGVLRP